jgi:aryl-alcohol dehydrogenase-like predicted oxidoreductase
MIEQVTLEKLGRTAGRIGFGCSPLGEHGWGKVDRTEMIRAIHSALDSGINLFDVADIYGLGLAEENLGAALAGKRQQAVIVSKFGLKFEPTRGTYYDTSPNWIETALTASLRRLRTDVIDVYLMHYWDERTQIADVIEALERARAAGKIRSYGFTNANPMALLAAAGLPQPAGMSAFSLQYNLIDRHFEGVIQRTLKAYPVTFLSWGSLAEGLLSGKFTKQLTLPPDDRRWRYRNFIGERFTENLRLVDAIGKTAATLGHGAGTLALRWILDRIPQSIALVGMKSRRNVESALKTSGWSTPTDIRLQLDLLTKARYRDDVPGIQYINSAGPEFLIGASGASSTRA